MKKIVICLAVVVIIVSLIFVYKYSTDRYEEKDDFNSTTNIMSTDTITTTINITTQPETEKQTTHVVVETNKLEGEFKAISQYPELPTGCEITSLTMVLNHLGYNVSKGELSDGYLNKGEVGKVDFRKQFEGDPRDDNSYGCYAPVIVDTANKYLNEVGSDKKAYDITGKELEELFEYTDEGIPVMTWCTYKLQEGHFSVTWNVDGKKLTWYTPEHCMVLLGKDEGFVYMADPAYGEVKKYDRELFEERYEELFRQAVVIK